MSRSRIAELLSLACKDPKPTTGFMAGASRCVALVLGLSAAAGLASTAESIKKTNERLRIGMEARNRKLARHDITNTWIRQPESRKEEEISNGTKKLTNG